MERLEFRIRERQEAGEKTKFIPEIKRTYIHIPPSIPINMVNKTTINTENNTVSFNNPEPRWWALKTSENNPSLSAEYDDYDSALVEIEEFIDAMYGAVDVIHDLPQLTKERPTCG